MTRERHPIGDDAPDPTIESLVKEVHQLKVHTSQLWDQAWWEHIGWRRRFWYWLTEGHRSPIRQFYFPRDP